MCFTLLGSWGWYVLLRILPALLGSPCQAGKSLQPINTNWLVMHPEYTLVSANLLSIFHQQYLKGCVWLNKLLDFKRNRVSEFRDGCSRFFPCPDEWTKRIEFKVKKKKTTRTGNIFIPETALKSSQSLSIQRISCSFWILCENTGGVYVPSSSSPPHRIPSNSPMQQNTDKENAPASSANRSDDAEKLKGIRLLLNTPHSSALLWEMVVLPSGLSVSIEHASRFTQAGQQTTNPSRRQRIVFLRELLQQERNVHHHNKRGGKKRLKSHARNLNA